VSIYTNFVNGRWTETRENDARIASFNPYTQEQWAEIAQASEKEVAESIDAAHRALTAWRRTSGTQRARLLNRLADLIDQNGDRLAVLESTDNGKAIRETRNQMNFAARNYRFFAGFADKLYGSYIPLDNYASVDYAAWEPIGVCILLTAWNSPIQLLSNKLAPALAAGNTVVIKPSEYASVTTLEFMRLVDEAGFPAGVVNTITGDGRVGNALCASPLINKISFTGGTQTGRAVMRTAAQNLVPVTLELGGKSPNIIFADADLERATAGAVAGIFGATGQTCMAGSRLLVQREIFDKIISALAERANAVVMGDPLDPNTEMGPVCTKGQLDRILEMIETAKSAGARLLAGGRRPSKPTLNRGLFVEPTVFCDVGPGMEIVREEVFGPVVAVMPFVDEDEAVAIANSSTYGLVAGVWTQHVSRAHRMAKALQAGTVWVNTYRTSVCQAPAGGTKHSGFGRERGWHGLLEYLQVKNVMIDYSTDARDPFSIKTS